MCGRYTITTSEDELVEVFDAPVLGGVDLGLPRYNIAPTQDAPIIAVGREGLRRSAAFRWGLVPRWADSPADGGRMINARSETVHVKPSFRDSFRSRRCLVPADGFYEWKRPESGGAKIPFWFHASDPDDALFAFAGLWDRWGSRTNELLSFTILTTRAGADVRPIHDRMPVILPSAVWDAWLDPSTPEAVLREALTPSPDGALSVRRVSTRVNTPANDDPGCIEPLDPDPGGVSE